MARAPRAAATATPNASVPAPAPATQAPVDTAPAPAPSAQEAPVAASSVPADLFDTAFTEAVAAEIDPTPTSPASAAVPKKSADEPKLAAAPAPEPAVPAVPAEPPVEPVAPAQPQPQPPQPPPPQPQPQAYQEPPRPQPQAYQEPPLFNAEEVTQLQTFYTDWPDVARATETMIKGIMAQTARRMYADMAASLAPYLQTIDTLADRSQLSELQEQVPDYGVVATQLTSWAANQPTYLRTAYEHVIKAGTAAEVVDLINRYKQDTQAAHSAAPGAQPAAAAPAAASVPTPAPAPVNPALAAAAARLAPVATKRTNVVAPPADFDSAFAEFARAS